VNVDRRCARINRLVPVIGTPVGRGVPSSRATRFADRFVAQIDVLRGLRFLGSFYVASNRRLLPSDVSEAARQAGYDPRGTGGFYTGDGSLRSDGDYRVLTQVGIDWFEDIYPSYKEQLLKKFPDAPDIDLG
jgi:hypothetical protein